MLCEQERLNNELIVEDWLLAALTVLIRSDLGFGGTVDGKWLISDLSRTH